MHKPFKRVQYSLYQAAFIGCFSLGLMSCDYFSDKSASDVGSGLNTEANPIINSREIIHIGTDLNINKLQPISKAYSERTGIAIDWVSIETDYNHSRFDIINNTFDNAAVTEVDANKLNINIASTKDKDKDNKNNDNEINSAFSPNLILPNNLDMLLVHSAYTMQVASQAHQLQPLGSGILMQSIPKQYQDPNGQWYGLSTYARTLVYNKNKVNEPELINYAGLADNKWFGRLCMTSIERPENQAIAKMMWAYRGRNKTPEILYGWLTNMGRPMPDDSSILEQLERGHCDVGVVDSDIFWQYAKAKPDTLIRLMWTNQINKGAMTNTITAGAVKTGQAVGAALDFMEWLVSDEGQALLAFYTSTFPIVEVTDTAINQQAIRPAWTEFDSDATPLSTIMVDRRVIQPEAPEIVLQQ